MRSMSRLPWVPVEAEINVPFEMPLTLIKRFSDLRAEMGYARL